MEETSIQPGDTVQTKKATESHYPPISFLVDEIQELHGNRMACGKYGCIHCDLLEKIYKV